MKKNIIAYILVSCIAGAVGCYLFIKYSFDNHQPVAGLTAAQPNLKNNSESTNVAQESGYCDYNVSRLKGYKYIKPLLDGERECESPKYGNLKGDIQNFIENNKRSGHLSYCSVFLKNLNSNEWMVINPSQGYHPGSLIKVAVLLAYLREAENNPAILNNYVAYEKDNTQYPKVQYKSDSIILGNRYRIKDLLYFMVAHSDNRATVVLENYMDISVFRRTFSDLGMRELSFSDTSYRISAKTYSNFFSVIYNAGLVNIASSEYAAQLLTECTFHEGLAKQLPSDVKIAHKFGEWGNGYEKELHESGIVYIADNPYILTVMTNGQDWNSLSGVLSEISKMVYDHMSQNGKGVAMK